MMKSRYRRRAADIHIMIDYVRDDLQNCRNNSASTRASGGQERAPVFENDCRRHRAQPLSRLDCIRFTANEPETIRHARFRGEIVHFVIPQDAGPFRDNPTAVCKINSIGVRNDVSVLIHNGEMCRIPTFVRFRIARTDLTGRPRFIEIDSPSDAHRIGL